ncbi:hypothetical protein HHK36_030711 [Tetracentron sinense]|uniref:RING-type E3 ubiquitin transferase n=1 Tax=Tetracentron sinense TaxID=13715 RepID=A0A834YDB2_TETSI|nr:hypothetical protein HHK36_030711 [Tetracentron sinense]
MNQSHHFPPFVLILVAILGSIFLLVSYYTIIRKYFSIRDSSRRTPPPQSDDTHEEFLDDNHDLVVEHPIWFITTVGLQQSIINSITICKYKRGEGLIEGTECSVCLNEFQEDETLRLLPKCSHAFHLPCIDTWLISHTNCPLCRSRIVTNSTEPHLSLIEPNYENLGILEETRVENTETDGGLGNDQVRESEVSEIRVGNEDLDELSVEDGRRDSEIAKDGVPSRHLNCEFRVLSDLDDNYRVGEDEVQPVRRSVSMESSSASMISIDLTNFLPVESEGSSATQSVEVKNSNLGVDSKRVGGNQSILRKIGSSYIGRSLQNGPISMKRSFSCQGKFLLSRSSQSRNSILPL